MAIEALNISLAAAVEAYTFTLQDLSWILTLLLLIDKAYRTFKGPKEKAEKEKSDREQEVDKKLAMDKLRIDEHEKRIKKLEDKNDNDMITVMMTLQVLLDCQQHEVDAEVIKKTSQTLRERIFERSK